MLSPTLSKWFMWLVHPFRRGFVTVTGKIRWLPQCERYNPEWYRYNWPIPNHTNTNHVHHSSFRHHFAQKFSPRTSNHSKYMGFFLQIQIAQYTKLPFACCEDYIIIYSIKSKSHAVTSMLKGLSCCLRPVLTHFLYVFQILIGISEFHRNLFSKVQV